MPEQVGNRMSTVHGALPPTRMKNVEWIIGTLRNGNQEFVLTFCFCETIYARNLPIYEENVLISCRICYDRPIEL